MRLAKPPSLLTAEEEIALARRVHGPDRADALAARNELVLRNLGLVGRAVGYYRMKSGSDHDDLFSEGVLGLIRAAELYDPERHTRFSTYAMPAVFHAVRTYVNRDRPIKIPNYLQEPSQVQSVLERSRTAQSKRRLDFNVRAAADAIVSFASLSQSADGDHRPDVPDRRPSPLDTLIQHETADQVVQALGQIPPLRAYILAHRLGLCGVPERTLRELGSELSLTRERIRQLEVQAKLDLTAALARDRRSCA
jgi:RNA polymerase sigma factor (sigma-70 family)